MRRADGVPSWSAPQSACVAVAVLLLAFALPATGQPEFVEITPPADNLFVTPPEEDFWVNAVAPADIDGDGDLDFAALGFYVVYHVSAVDMLVLFMSEGADADGNWTFTHVDVPLGDVYAGSSDLAWGDYDRDGDPDLAVGSEGATVIYRNDAGTLTALSNELPGYLEDSGYTGAYDLRSLTWADYDNDGDLDLLVPSVFDFVEFDYRTVLLRNDGADGGSGWLFTETTTTLDPTAHAQSLWADDDADNDLDLFLVNVDPYLSTGFVKRYENTEGTFAAEDLIGITVEYGLADWSDYDGDGDLDIVVAGNIQEIDSTYDTVLRIYTNTGAGSYEEETLISSPNADWLDLHAATWADYDSDGDVDLLITGNYVGDGEILGKSDVYINEAGLFSPLGLNLQAPISSVGRGGTFTWFDIDADGDLDYFIGGAYYVPDGNGLVDAQLHLFRNDTVSGNSSPSTPGDPFAMVGEGSVELSWSSAFDDLTEPEALTYELDVRRLGVAPGVAVSQRLPEPGNLSAVTGWTLRDLAPGDYSWRVRAVDSAFNGGPWAEGSFTIDPTQPDLVLSGPCPGQVTVTATNLTPNANVAVLRSKNLNGWVKPRGVCTGVELELGLPFLGKPRRAQTDASGALSFRTSAAADACGSWIEVLDITSCQTTPAAQLPPE